MVSAVDDSVGAINQALSDLDLADNTVVIFFLRQRWSLHIAREKNRLDLQCTFALRKRLALRGGGIREATIIRAPGVTKPGSVCDDPVFSTDFFPTMLDLAGLPMLPEKHVDGITLRPLLEGGSYEKERTLFWHYPHYHGSSWKPGAAIREGNWKLIEFWEYDEVELYNLAEDIGEKNNLADKNPEKAAEMQKKLSNWQKQIQGQNAGTEPELRFRAVNGPRWKL